MVVLSFCLLLEVTNYPISVSLVNPADIGLVHRIRSTTKTRATFISTTILRVGFTLIATAGTPFALSLSKKVKG